MKNATPSDKRKHLALEKINSQETEKIAVKYRKLAGIYNQDFSFLVEELSIPTRHEAVEELIAGKDKILRAFLNFRKTLAKKYPEYQYLIMRDDWRPIISEIFIFGDIQEDTFKNIPFGNVSWVQEKQDEKALYLKIIPGANNKQVFDFLNQNENDVLRKLKKIGVIVPKVKTRSGKIDTYSLDLWVRVLDIFSSDEIRNAFALRYSTAYTEKFTLNGKRKQLERAKNELIAHYVFHRFGLKKPDGKVYSPDYIKSILKKAKDNKTKIKPGLFKDIP